MKTPIRVSYVRKHEVKLLLGLEAELQGHDERVVHACQDQPFRKCMRNLAPLHDVLLADRLERIDTRRVAFADLHDLRGSYMLVNKAHWHQDIDLPSRSCPYQ